MKFFIVFNLNDGVFFFYNLQMKVYMCKMTWYPKEPGFCYGFVNVYTAQSSGNNCSIIFNDNIIKTWRVSYRQITIDISHILQVVACFTSAAVRRRHTHTHTHDQFNISILPCNNNRGGLARLWPAKCIHSFIEFFIVP